MSVLELSGIINGTFGVTRNTLEGYVHAPMFVTERGRIRLRNEADPTTNDPSTGPLRDQGTFRLGEGRAAKLLTVGNSMLRGRAIPWAARPEPSSESNSTRKENSGPATGRRSR